MPWFSFIWCIIVDFHVKSSLRSKIYDLRQKQVSQTLIVIKDYDTTISCISLGRRAINYFNEKSFIIDV